MKTQQIRPPRASLIQGLYAIGLGPLIGRMILLLTTTGRKSGLLRVTPLQYEQVGEDYYVGSSRGSRADWYRNICANPQVTVRVKSRRFVGIGETVEDTKRIADFLELKLERHPAIMARIMAMEGLPALPTREQLLEYAKSLTMVIIHPES
jgi:deazaflavin-dependent oxidoreductase (nitroreductase family)